MSDDSKSDGHGGKGEAQSKYQQQAARVEQEAAGHAAGMDQDQLDDLVASSDTGGRSPGGLTNKFILGVALFWSLFQLWIASPLPFMLRIGVFNDTETRSIHLALAIFLAYLVYPATKSMAQTILAVAVPVILGSLYIFGADPGELPIWMAVIIVAAIVAAILMGSPKNRIPLHEWALALVAAFCALYLFTFYTSLSDRPGAPIQQDIIIGAIGLIVLLEAARRSLGPALMIVATVFLVYTFLGRYMPSIIAHKGNGLSEVINHHWVTTEGVFGIALGVSSGFVFLFVLFGALLDKAGAGNYFIQVAFSLMGHMRGGPAKAAVVSSGMTGLISG
ncbi:MAG: TRAP transporter large permease subunit, partial [Alphaproteobacteria bacterium]